MSMDRASITAGGVIGAGLVAVLGIAFFFVIIGVFGQTASIAALLLFIAFTLVVLRRTSSAGARP